MTGNAPYIAELIGRFRALSYMVVPEARGKRDLRIDMLRGFCVFVMIVDHVGGEASWLYVLTGGNQFFVSAAEGFVLLSGVSMGLVHGSVIQRDGLRAMLDKVAGRVRFLYVLTVALTLAFAAASALLGTPWAAAATPAAGKIAFAIEVITFHRSYSLTDVLVLYTLLVLAAGPLLVLMSRRRGTALVLIGSFAAWSLAQISLNEVPRAWAVVDGGFPFSAWQLLFVIGLAIGYHRQRLGAYLCPSRLFAVGIVAVLSLIAINAIATHLVAGWVGSDAQEVLFDKNDARVGRILALLGAASFLYALVTVAWVPVRRATGWLLMPLGMRSLYAYGVQLFVVAFWSSTLMAPVRLDRENALFQGAAVLMVWTACLLRPLVSAMFAHLKSSIASSVARLGLPPRAVLRPAALGLATFVFAASCGGASLSAAAARSVTNTTAATILTVASATAVPADSWKPATLSTGGVGDPGPGHVEQGAFYSQALKRTMTYLVYLPPTYSTDTSARYATLYMLHGGSGYITEWVDYGLLSTADELMRAGTIAAMIIVLPEGDQEYWVDHVMSTQTGANGEKWGTYTATEVVPTIDSRYRTITSASARAIGGLSMGGHGAIQLALNFPGIWSVVGSHSPSLRIEGDAPTYFGHGAEFAARDPYALIAANPQIVRTITWWIDSGEVDPWHVQAQALGAELSSLGIPNEWHFYSGDHSAEYWSAHVRDYVLFYGTALAGV